MPVPGTVGNTLIEAGPWLCTSSANFEIVTSVLSQYLQNTEIDLNATTRYLILNLHAAAPASNPTGSPQQPSPDAMPQQGNLLSSILSSSNSVYLYSPSELAEERADLNGTGHWYGGSRIGYQPDPAYLVIGQRPEGNGGDATSDGWPTEGFLELQRAKRLVAGYGTVDPQMLVYNFSGDAEVIFPSNYLQATPDVATTAGDVTNGCFFSHGEDLPSGTNSSWAISAITNSTQPSDVLDLVANLTSCGISPLLNRTLNNTSAAEDYTPYQAYTSAAEWAWAPGEPRNASQSTSDNDEGVQYSCAALNGTTGRWQASDCAQNHYAACRVATTPYRWQISSMQGRYTNVNEGCPEDTKFAVPRTSLENTYLIAAWREYLASSDPDAGRDPILWLNFNDLSTNACWVVGQNATCPYTSPSHAQGRTIVVPTVAAILVFVLAALTMFVKCAANRQKSRSRRRRGDDGWDYEGVPS